MLRTRYPVTRSDKREIFFAVHIHVIVKVGHPPWGCIRKSIGVETFLPLIRVTPHALS